MSNNTGLGAPSSACGVVVGGGIMGADVAFVLQRAGVKVWLVEPDMRRHKALLDRLEKDARPDPRSPHRRAAHVVTRLDDVCWDSVGIVIECIPEDLMLKQALFKELEEKAPANALLASNSSSFPISQIVTGLASSSRMLGLHFFMPAHVVPLVEVVLGKQTRPDYAQTLAEFMRRCGCVPILVRKDIPGFIANRLQHALAREAYSLIDAGVATPEDIDAAVRFGFGFRYLAAGPILQKEHAGWDVHSAAATTIYPSLSNITAPPPVVVEKIEKGQIGMKSGQGFYGWDQDSISREKDRYHRVLQAALAAIADELPPISP